LAGREITGWIGGEAATDGFSITPEAAGMLAEFFGADLWQLKNEWDKIIGHKKAADPKGKEISAEDVLAISFGRIENSIFALTDAIGARDRALAFRLLEEELSAGGEPGYIFNMILRQVRIVLEIRESLDLGKSAREIAAAFKLKPFVVQKGMNQARRFTAEQLKKLFSRLVEADYLVKTGRGEIKTLVELALAD